MRTRVPKVFSCTLKAQVAPTTGTCSDRKSHYIFDFCIGFVTDFSLLSAPTAPFGFSSGRIAVHAETPDMVVPSK